jgi:hypothetical protein
MRPKLFKQFQVILMMLTILVIVTQLDFQAAYPRGPVQQPMATSGAEPPVTTTAWLESVQHPSS